MRIGVLALQGAFAVHVARLRALGHEAVEARSARDLEGCEGLVLPGGESTSLLILLDRDPALLQALQRVVDAGTPVLATCAGLVLAAREVRGPSQRSFGWLDVTVRRNGWGRQRHSAEAVADDGVTPLVLIRAPRIERVGPGVHVEATLRGEPVLVRSGRFWGATFHPELTGESALHARVFAFCERRGQRCDDAAENTSLDG